jgi:hypothetical protein
MDIVLAYAQELALAIGGIVVTAVLAGGLVAVRVVARGGEERLHIVVKED